MGYTFIDGMFIINDYVAVGAELGLYGMSSESDVVVGLFDIPILAIVEGHLFDILRVKGHLGYTFSSHLVMDETDQTEYVNKFDLGDRVYLGSLYIDYSTLKWGDSKSSVKWGLGFWKHVIY